MNSQQNRADSQGGDSEDLAFPLAVPTRGRIRRRNPALPAHLRAGWMRGKGYVRGESVFLPVQNQRFYSTTRREFHEETEKDAIFAFLQIAIDIADEVEGFVARYGLLTEDGLRDGQEPLEAWDDFQGQLIACMELYWAIQEVLKGDGGKVGTLNVLYDVHNYRLRVAHSYVGQPDAEWARSYIEDDARGLYGRPSVTRPNDSQRQNLVREAYLVLVQALDALTETVYHRFSFDLTPARARANAVQIATPGFLTSGPESADLRGYLAAQLGYFMQDARPVHLCKCGCGRFFVPKRADQEYALPSCSSNVRVSKHRRRKAKLEFEDDTSHPAA